MQPGTFCFGGGAIKWFDVGGQLERWIRCPAGPGKGVASLSPRVSEGCVVVSRCRHCVVLFCVLSHCCAAHQVAGLRPLSPQTVTPDFARRELILPAATGSHQVAQWPACVAHWWHTDTHTYMHTDTHLSATSKLVCIIWLHMLSVGGFLFSGVAGDLNLPQLVKWPLRSGVCTGGELAVVALLFDPMLGGCRKMPSDWPPSSRFTSHVTANPSHRATSCEPPLAAVCHPPMVAIGPLGEEIHRSLSLSPSPVNTLHDSATTTLSKQRWQPVSHLIAHRRCPPTERTFMQRSRKQAPPTPLPAGRWGLGVRGEGEFEQSEVWVMFLFQIAPRALNPWNPFSIHRPPDCMSFPDKNVRLCSHAVLPVLWGSLLSHWLLRPPQL